MTHDLRLSSGVRRIPSPNRGDMRVGINLLYLLPGVVGGTQTYATELLKALAALEDAPELVLFTNAESRNLDWPRTAKTSVVPCDVTASWRGARYYWEQVRLPRELRRHGVDVLHSLGYVGPVWCPVPHVVTVHDLNYRSPYVEMRALRRAVLSAFVEASARRASQVIAVSEFSRRAIIDGIGVPAERVVTIHHGTPSVGEGGDAVPPGPPVMGAPYVVAFGSLAAHKNLSRLVEAFGRVAARVPHSLVIVGHLGDSASVTRLVAACGLAGRVVVTGYVSELVKRRVLAGADVLAFPSLYEGFGLPVLEAQQLGVPVVSSRAASLPEIGGEGALYFDPLSVDDMAGVLRRVLCDPSERDRLAEVGRRNASRFTWESAARRTLGVYQAVLRPECQPRGS